MANDRDLEGPKMKPATAWKLRSKSLKCGPVPLVMGIVNVTPDSFSDGGKFSTADLAIEHGLRLADEGAAILDIGGESTRPYSTPVELDEELKRVIPVIEGIAKQSDVPVSIDTSKSAVAAAAIEAGAQIINDVTGLEGDPGMVKIVLDSGVGICAMHMKGNPQNMQDAPEYFDVVREIHAYLAQRKSHLLEAGIELERICLDPGIGFGKTHEHNLRLIRDCDQYHDLGCPILIGHSRKGFIGKMLGEGSAVSDYDKVAGRDAGTLAITLKLAEKGIQIVRVHEVANTVAALRVQAGLGSA